MFLSSHSFPLHFETGKHPRTPVFLADEEYSKALDCLTKACTDLLVINSETKQVLIGKRKVHPQPDWWYGAGGRMKPGENCYESAARILKRELGFVLPPAALHHVSQDGGSGGRFQGVGAYSYTWEMREQEPKTHGCADISVVLAIQVTPEEISAFKMDNQEYETHAWLDPVSEVVEDATKHDALRRSVADYVKVVEWNALLARLDTSATDAEMGGAFKQFVQRWKEVDARLEQTSSGQQASKRARQTM